jgi:hypothetical protein
MSGKVEVCPDYSLFALLKVNCGFRNKKPIAKASHRTYASGVTSSDIDIPICLEFVTCTWLPL